MSKGPRKPKKDRPTVTTRDPEPDGVVDHEPDKCWPFALVSRTPAAVKVEKGASVTGAIHGSQVLVSASSEVLGRAPDAESKQIIEAAKNTKKKLRGEVLSNGKGKSDTLVELCLRG